MEVLEGAEELKTDAGCYDEQTHRKENETAKLLSRTKDLHENKTSSNANRIYIILIHLRHVQFNLWLFNSIWNIPDPNTDPNLTSV